MAAIELIELIRKSTICKHINGTGSEIKNGHIRSLYCAACLADVLLANPDVVLRALGGKSFGPERDHTGGDRPVECELWLVPVKEG